MFSQLEAYENLEASIIRTTEVHKVISEIPRLKIPKDKEYNFRKRSAALLDIWNKRIEADDAVDLRKASKAVSRRAGDEEFVETSDQRGRRGGQGLC